MPTALIFAFAALAALLIAYMLKRKKTFHNVKDDKEEYKVPLSDDIQRVYYDAYEKEMSKMKSAEESSNNDDQTSSEDSILTEDETSSKE